MSVIVKYSYHVTGGLLVKLQWYVYQNKAAEGFFEINFYSLGKVTSLLCYGIFEKNYFCTPKLGSLDIDVLNNFRKKYSHPI